MTELAAMNAETTMVDGRTLLITGATGNQGGATIDALLASPTPWRIKAFVRDPASPRATALAMRGVELTQGDLGDAASMRRALAGAYGVLSVQTPMGPDGAEGEERQGKLLATLAAEAGIRHLVYCSAGGAERDSGVPHFESKRAIERHTAALGLPATVLRPVAFMENFGTFAFRTVMLSMMRTYLRPNQAMQVVSARDVGWFAVQAFERPGAYVGQEMEIGGDAVTYLQAAATLRQAGMRPATSFKLPGPILRQMPEDFRLMFAWIARAGFQADVPELRRAYPGLRTLQAWAASAGARH
jgi:uncharacterized protein YbjT (DUF2867 family)